MAAKKKRTGPKPEILKVEGDWKDAISHALTRGKPPEVRTPKKAAKKRKKG